MDAKLKSIKDTQKIIDFIAKSYSPEEIFSLGRHLCIDKITYFGFGMNNSQLGEAFITKVFQENKQDDMLDLIQNNKTFKRNNFESFFGLEEEKENNSDKRSITNSLHAIIIGVNDYSKVECFDSLTYSAKDAQDLSNIIEKQWNIDKNNIYLFNESNNTTYDIIINKLRDCMLNLSENDNLLIYFSGHGDSDSDEIKGNSYLILSDTYQNTMDGKYENAINLKELNELTKQCKAKIKFRVFDACKCGQSFSKGKTLSSKFKSDMFGSGNGWITMTSCSVNEYSYEDPKFSNGVFTHFIIEGLQGKARRSKGKMLVEDLKIYVADKVPKNTNYEQNPQYHCEIEGNIYIE